MKKMLPMGLGILLCTAGSPIFAQSISNELDDIRSTYNLVGMVTGVSCQGETFEAYYGGVSRIPSQQAMDANTYMRIASISKAFTAAGLMRLYDQGAFELNDDISDALGYTVRNPLYPSVAITYRMLLSHRSSLQDGTGYSPFLNATVSTNNPPSISTVLLPGGTFYTSNMWRLQVPGSGFAYSNINYGLIGTLIEALSGQRFDEFMLQEVLEPLGIPGSFNVADIDDIENVAVLYRNSLPQIDNFQGIAPPAFNNPNYVPGTNGARFGPQGGLRTTLNGLMNFGNMLVNDGLHNGEQFLDSLSVSLMMRREWNYNGSNGDNYFGLFNSWGLGLHRSLGNTGSATGDAVIEDQLMIGHPGEAYGLVSDLYVDPASKFVLAFMSTGYSSGGNYAFGLNTTFYRVEEEVFAAIGDSLWGACQALVVEPTEPCDDAPVNLQSNIGEDGTLLTWNPIAGSVGCRVNGQLITPNGPIGNQTIDIAEPEAASLFVPTGQLIEGASYQWRVRCACSLSPMVATAWSAWQVFVNGSGMDAMDGENASANENLSDDFELYPNPTVGRLYVQSEASLFQISVYDLAGRVMHQSNHSEAGTAQLELDHLRAGTYVLRFQSGDKVRSRLFVKQ